MDHGYRSGAGIPHPTECWCNIATALSDQLHCADYTGRQLQEQTCPHHDLRCKGDTILASKRAQSKEKKK